MDRFELTEEQKRQGQQALQAGEKRVHVTCTPEQHEYMNWFQNREGEAPAEPKRKRKRTIHAAQEDLRPPMPSMIRF